MYSELRAVSKFLTNEANVALDNIIWNPCVESDECFAITLRALLHSRVPADKTISLLYNSASSRTRLDDFIYLILSGGCKAIILNVITTGGNGETLFNYIKKEMAKDTGLKELEDVEIYLSSKFKINALIYTDSVKERVAIFVENSSPRRLRLIQSLLPRYFSWWFIDKPLTDIEKELLKALTEQGKDAANKFFEISNAIADCVDFRSRSIEKKLKGFDTLSYKRVYNNTKNTLRDLEYEIKSLNDSYYRKVSKYNEINSILRSLEFMLKSKDAGDETMKYFLNNKMLTLYQVHNESIVFIVSCYLDNFDIEAYKSVIKSDRNFITDFYHENNRAFSKENMIKILDGLFLHENLKLKMCAAYEINPMSWVIARSDFVFGEEFADRVPNPHIQKYSCLGNYSRVMNEALMSGDMVLTIEQCIASAKSINIVEGATIVYILEAIADPNCAKILELPDGTSCTPTEAIAWLESQENIQGGV